MHSLCSLHLYIQCLKRDLLRLLRWNTKVLNANQIAYVKTLSCASQSNTLRDCLVVDVVSDGAIFTRLGHHKEPVRVGV